MKHFTVTFKTDDKQISVHRGCSLAEAAGLAGIVLNTVCGGKGTCGKCAVIIEPQGRKVLACQHSVERDITVRVPATSRFTEHKILEKGIKKEIQIEPNVYKKYLKDVPANADAVINVLDNICERHQHRLSEKAVEQLEALVSAGGAERGLTAVCHIIPQKTPGNGNVKLCPYMVRCFETGDTTEQLFGVAVDIGTTTVAAKLVRLADGITVAGEADFNPQARHGDDVVSRITYAENDDKLGVLQGLIKGCINELVKKLCVQASIEPRDIYEVCVVGNTTMNHMFLRLPVSQLGRAPYRPYSVDAFDLSAGSLGLDINPEANVHTVENIAGFVGSDTVAAALATDIGTADEMTLIVDIGTNGEIVLGTAEKLLAASCAAGPALEGARISQGSRAVCGAIEAVELNEDDIDLAVIGNCETRSICGSGLIDAVAVLLDLGIIDRTGRFVDREELRAKVPKKIFEKIIEYEGQPAFVLAGIYNNESSQSVMLTQRDIREVQLAKAAIRTGSKLLQEKMGLKDSNISKVLLAGAFGNYIRKESALKIGLLPDVPPERIQFVGNAAGSGALMVLLSRTFRQASRELAGRIEYIEIAHETHFQTVYADCMFF